MFHEYGQAGRYNEASICLSQFFSKHDYKTGNVIWPIHTTTTKATKVTMATVVTKVIIALLISVITKVTTVPLATLITKVATATTSTLMMVTKATGVTTEW